MGRHFSVKEKSGKTDWKSQGKSHKIPENSGNFRDKCYLLFSSDESDKNGNNKY